MHSVSGSLGHRRVGKLLWSVTFLCQFVLAAQAAAVEPDKIAHFSGAAATGLAVDTVFYHFASEMGPAGRIATSTGLSLIPGLLIEIGDELSPKNQFGWDDFLADGLGALTGVLAAELINGQFWIAASGRQIRLIGRW